MSRDIYQFDVTQKQLSVNNSIEAYRKWWFERLEKYTTSLQGRFHNYRRVKSAAVIQIKNYHLWLPLVLFFLNDLTTHVTIKHFRDGNISNGARLEDHWKKWHSANKNEKCMDGHFFELET